MPRLSALAIVDFDAIALPATGWPLPFTLGEAFAAWGAFAACVVVARLQRSAGDRAALRARIAAALADCAFRWRSAALPTPAMDSAP